MSRRTIGRRALLRAGGAGATAALLSPWRAVAAGSQTAPAVSRAKVMPKAILFDCFGTVVQWRNSIIAEGTAWGKARGLQVDWAKFADQWRAGQGREMGRVRRGEMPWTNLDGLHRMILDRLLTEFNITGLSEAEKVEWNHVWHRLQPWPDTIPGLTRLKKKYTIAPLSNASFAMLTNMAKNAGLPWDAILTAELAKQYKTAPQAYLTAVELLGLKPGEVMMGASHGFDLKAARTQGLLTGHINRPSENDVAQPGDFDVVAKDMVDFAAQLGT
jgi:2-haloacid dehalogenase